MEIIEITGKAGAGKTTLANALATIAAKYEKRAIVLSFATSLKDMCTELYQWTGEKDGHGRTILQHIGQTVRQKKKDFWVDIVKMKIELIKNEYDFVIIDDMRYPNEKLSGAYTIEVKRESGAPMTDEQKEHESEKGGIKTDVVLNNVGDKNELNIKAQAIYIALTGEL